MEQQKIVVKVDHNDRGGSGYLSARGYIMVKPQMMTWEEAIAVK